MTLQASTIAYPDIAVDAEQAHEYTITSAIYEGFLRAFQDRSPIHVDDDYARARGFRGAVMHGAILNGFVSHFVGMVFPGSHSLLLSVELRFSRPCYLGEQLRLTGKVAQKVDAQQVVVLHLGFFSATQGLAIASGRAQVKLQNE